jgi:Uma2 family endonuclease
MTEQVRKTYMTAEDLFLIPSDDYKYELVNGLLVRMPPAGALHGKIAVTVVRILAEHVEAHDLGVVCATDTGFILQRNPDIVRGPDAAFVAKARVPSSGVPEAFWPFAPDLAVEVVSPRDRAGEIEEKIAEYLAAGTRVVWLIHPRTRTVLVHRSPTEVEALGEGDDLAGGDVLPGFSCPVRRFFQ